MRRSYARDPAKKLGTKAHSEEPDEADIEGRVPGPADLVVDHAVADVAVAVKGNGSDAEDGANGTQAHHEGTGLAVCLPQGPAILEDGRED